MALIGINSPNQKPKVTAIDKVAQGLGIANSVLGVSLAVPKYLQERATSQATIAAEQSRQANNNTDTALKIGQDTLPADPNNPNQNVVQGLPSSYGPRVMKPAKEDATAQNNIFAQFGKDYKIAPKLTDDGFAVKYNGNDVYFQPKDDAKQKIGEQNISSFKDYMNLSKGFTDTSDRTAQVIQSADQNSHAGDLKLAMSFFKLINPTIRTNDGSALTAEDTGSLPQRFVGEYNKLLTNSGSLSPEVRDDFVRQSLLIANGQIADQKRLENHWAQVTQANNLDPQLTFIPLAAPLENLINKSPSAQRVLKTVGPEVHAADLDALNAP